MNQFDAKQPTTTYEMFQEKCLGEACRPLNYPLNLALGTSQKFNFSSAKLDHVNYRNGLTVERTTATRSCSNPALRAVVRRGRALRRDPRGQGTRSPPRHEWHWPGFEPLDPVTDAQADHERLSNGTDTYRGSGRGAGYDWQTSCASRPVRFRRRPPRPPQARPVRGRLAPARKEGRQRPGARRERPLRRGLGRGQERRERFGCRRRRPLSAPGDARRLVERGHRPRREAGQARRQDGIGAREAGRGRHQGPRQGGRRVRRARGEDRPRPGEGRIGPGEGGRQAGQAAREGRRRAPGEGRRRRRAARRPEGRAGEGRRQAREGPRPGGP
jgi:hypothetical protein